MSRREVTGYQWSAPTTGEELWEGLCGNSRPRLSTQAELDSPLRLQLANEAANPGSAAQIEADRKRFVANLQLRHGSAASGKAHLKVKSACVPPGTRHPAPQKLIAES